MKRGSFTVFRVGVCYVGLYFKVPDRYLPTVLLLTS